MLKKKDLTDRQINFYSQLFGNLSYAIKGHHALSVMREYKITDQINNKTNHYEESEVEFYFLLFKKNENQSYVIFWSICDFSLFDYEISLIEFAENGFWLSDPGIINYKEKFIKSKS